MNVALFGNYSFARVACEQLVMDGFSPTILANGVENDDKYGPGIISWAQLQGYPVFVGNFTEHCQVVADSRPSFGLSVAYKQVIRLDQLAFPVYGIHFGGLYGTSAIRGRSSSFWYRLRGLTEARCTLYRMTKSAIDFGTVVRESSFQIPSGRSDDIELQLDSISKLVSYLPRFRLVEAWPLSEERSSSWEELGPYFPRADVRRYSPRMYDDNESSVLQAVGAGARDVELAVASVRTSTTELFELQPGLTGASKHQVLHLHGLAGSVPGKKLERLVDLLGDSTLVAPLLPGIHKDALDGLQSVKGLEDSLIEVISLASQRRAVLVCSSLSCLLAARILRQVEFSGHVVFVTPIVDMMLTPLDPALTDGGRDVSPLPYVSLTSDRYSGLKVSKDLVSYLRSCSLLAEVRNRRYTCDVILALEDDLVPAVRTRRALVDAGLPINRVNVIEGSHTFASLLQLTYLSCVVHRAQSRELHDVAHWQNYAVGN